MFVEQLSVLIFYCFFLLGASLLLQQAIAIGASSSGTTPFHHSKTRPNNHHVSCQDPPKRPQTEEETSQSRVGSRNGRETAQTPPPVCPIVVPIQSGTDPCPILNVEMLMLLATKKKHKMTALHDPVGRPPPGPHSLPVWKMDHRGNSALDTCAESTTQRGSVLKLIGILQWGWAVEGVDEERQFGCELVL